MHPIRRTAAALVAATAIAAAPLAHAEAAPHAKPHGSSSHGSSHRDAAQVRAALKQVAVKDRALARVATSKGLATLPAEQSSVLAGSVAADRAALADLRAAVTAGTTKPRAARVALKAYRVENYLQAVAVLRDAAELAGLAVDLPEVLDLVDGAVEGALGVTATGGRALLKVARADLEDAWALYEELTAEPEDCTVDEFGDCTDDGTDDGDDSDDDGTDGGTDGGGDSPVVDPLA